MNSLLRMFVAALLGASVVVAFSGQLTKDKQDKSSELMAKARQLDLLNYLVPLVMTKDQVNKLLIPVEKAQANVERIKLMEAKELLQLESKINDAIDKGVNKGQVPTRELLTELNKLFGAFGVRRRVAGGENADLVYEVIKKEFNAGQLKAAANAHDIKEFDPNIDVSKLTEEAKIKFFIKDVFLDPECYGLLVKMSRASG